MNTLVRASEMVYCGRANWWRLCFCLIAVVSGVVDRTQLFGAGDDFDEAAIEGVKKARGVNGEEARLVVTNAKLNAGQSISDQLTGWGFGGGIAVFHVNGSRPVKNASMDEGGILRVETDSKVRAGGTLETHWLFNDLPFVSSENTAETKAKRRVARLLSSSAQGSGTGIINHVTWGPLVTVELGDDVIRSAGLGAILAFRHFDVSPTGDVSARGAAINVGFVLFVEPNVQTLPEGLVANEAVPPGTPVTLQKEHRFGVGFVFTGSF
jgi:hypothetical protein